VSLFIGLNTGLTAIRAARAGLDTATHNIANSNTEGYTRQRVELAAMIPFNSPDGPIGTGVDVTRIARLRDAFLDARVRTTLGEFARQDVRAGLLGRVEQITGEPDNGISNELTTLWNTFEDLALSPYDPAVRRQVLVQLDTVASAFRSVASGWDQLAADTTVRRDVAVSEVNGVLTEIAAINRQVANQDPVRVSNDLLDQRDLLADRLAELTGAGSTLQADGTLSVHLGGVALVAGSTVTALSVAGTDLLAGATAVTATLTGEIAALHGFVTTELPSRQAELEAVATALADRLNTQHAAGFTDTGAAGGALLTFTPGDAARTLTVAATGVGDLAVAGSVGGSGVPGSLDGENAQALADLRTTPGPTGTTIAQQFNALIVDLGAQVAASQRSASAAGDLAVSAQVARQSQHGVSLDEEMVDVVRYQRALEAASRVMTAIDEALEVLVNRVGIVGR
jgi:flagellar hook-associated protein 1